MTSPILDGADLRRELIDSLVTDGYLHSPAGGRRFSLSRGETFVDPFTVLSRTGETVEHDLVL